mmetsp:Transcript_20877/g.50539  ORF Transcript_20877/g.50539 Transcript_20877/m.50539 type:complete len:224 (-) Transcript_20877:7-678(-)
MQQLLHLLLVLTPLLGHCQEVPILQNEARVVRTLLATPGLHPTVLVHPPGPFHPPAPRWGGQHRRQVAQVLVRESLRNIALRVKHLLESEAHLDARFLHNPHRKVLEYDGRPRVVRGLLRTGVDLVERNPQRIHAPPTHNGPQPFPVLLQDGLHFARHRAGSLGVICVNTTELELDFHHTRGGSVRDCNRVRPARRSPLPRRSRLAPTRPLGLGRHGGFQKPP